MRVFATCAESEPGAEKRSAVYCAASRIGALRPAAECRPKRRHSGKKSTSRKCSNAAECVSVFRPTLAVANCQAPGTTRARMRRVWSDVREATAAGARLNASKSACFTASAQSMTGSSVRYARDARLSLRKPPNGGDHGLTTTRGIRGMSVRGAHMTGRRRHPPRREKPRCELR